MAPTVQRGGSRLNVAAGFSGGKAVEAFQTLLTLCDAGACHKSHFLKQQLLQRTHFIPPSPTWLRFHFCFYILRFRQYICCLGTVCLCYYIILLRLFVYVLLRLFVSVSVLRFPIMMCTEPGSPAVLQRSSQSFYSWPSLMDLWRCVSDWSALF